MSTCNRLDLPTLGSQPVMSKNLPAHWLGATFKIEVFNALQIRFGPSKYTSLKTTPQNVTP